MGYSRLPVLGHDDDEDKEHDDERSWIGRDFWVFSDETRLTVLGHAKPWNVGHHQ